MKKLAVIVPAHNEEKTIKDTLVGLLSIKPELNKIESFIVPKGIGVNYNPGVWHFPLISTEDMNFLVVDRLGSGDNLVLHNLNKENITLEFKI